MAGTIKTVKVELLATGDAMVINESDFNPDRHMLIPDDGETLSAVEAYEQRKAVSPEKKKDKKPLVMSAVKTRKKIGKKTGKKISRVHLA